VILLSYLSKIVDLLISCAHFRLDPADLLSLRASCRFFHKATSAFGKKIDTILNQEDHSATDETAVRLHYDQYRRLASKEMVDTPGDPIMEVTTVRKYLCSFCLDLHSPTFFAPNEVDKSAWVRVCIGSTAKIIRCGKIELTFNDIFNRGRYYLSTGISGGRLHSCSAINHVRLCSRGPRIFVVSHVQKSWEHTHMALAPF
jgi:hypothetical protein